MTNWLDRLGPDIGEAFKQHPVLGLLLAFLIALWAIALRTETISLGDMVGLTLAIVILGLLSEGVIRIIRSRRVSATPSVLFDETHGQEKWERNNPPPTYRWWIQAHRGDHKAALRCRSLGGGGGN